MLHRMHMALPAFAYHPDPLSTGSVVRSAEECERCEVARGYVYAGPIYSAQEIEFLCPWCIADGSAARAFDAEFGNVDGAPSDVPVGVLEEIVRRTPGFAGWQQERWLFHCSDGAEFQGRAGYNDVAPLPGVLDLIAADGLPQDALQHMSKDGDLTGYLFRCRHCSTPLAYADFL